jgi:hypothetical protein
VHEEEYRGVWATRENNEGGEVQGFGFVSIVSFYFEGLLSWQFMYLVCMKIPRQSKLPSPQNIRLSTTTSRSREISLQQAFTFEPLKKIMLTFRKTCWDRSRCKCLGK